MIDLFTTGPTLFRLARQGLRTFLRTLAVAILGGIVLGMICGWFLREESGYYRFLSWTLILIECLVVGFYLAGRRAVANTMAEGLTSMRLGSSLLGLVFDKMPSATQSAPQGGQLAPGLQKLEPGKAEILLNNSTEDVKREASASSWLPQKLQSKLLDLVQKYAQVRVRENAEGKKEIDLQSLQGEMKDNIDQRLADQVRSSSRFWTTAALIGLPLLAALQTYLLLHLANSTGP